MKIKPRIVDSLAEQVHTTPAGEVLTCEFARGPLFRSVRFPEPVDPRRVKAEIRNGLLRVTAPVAGRTKVEVTAS